MGLIRHVFIIFDITHDDRKFSTVHLKTRWLQVFHITQNVCWRITQSRKLSTPHECWYTRWPEVFHITQNVGTHDDPKFSTLHECWYTRWPEVFHSALITTISASCPQCTQCLLTVHTMTRSFPQYTQCQMLVHTMTRSFPHHTQCVLTNLTMTRSFPQCINHHDISKLSISHTIFASSIFMITQLSIQEYWCKLSQTVNVSGQKYGL